MPNSQICLHWPLTFSLRAVLLGKCLWAPLLTIVYYFIMRYIFLTPHLEVGVVCLICTRNCDPHLLHDFFKTDYWDDMIWIFKGSWSIFPTWHQKKILWQLTFPQETMGGPFSFYCHQYSYFEECQLSERLK